MSATARAFATWRSMRSGRVSMPVRMWNALVGDRAGPRSRNATARAFIENPKSPKLSKKSSPWYASSGPATNGNLPLRFQSNRPDSTSIPPIDVPCPDRNLVSEWTTRSAPHSNGRHR